MVKIYALSVLFKGPVNAIWLKSAYELATFSFFQRGSVQEFMAFVSKTIVERTQTAARQSVKEGGIKGLLNGRCGHILHLSYVTLNSVFFFRIHVSRVCSRR